MNSAERHERRYQRRKERRQIKKIEFNKNYCDFDKVFTFDNLYTSYKKCCKGVRWKSTTQRYMNNVLYNLNITYKSLHSGSYKSKGFNEFDIVERGKPRHIQSIHIGERIVQRCLCDYCLMPVIRKLFVYDNGACQKHKGLDFALNRMNRHLDKYFRQYGQDGYALQFDFSQYFKHIDHDALLKILIKIIPDARLYKFIEMLIKDFGDVGMGLGCQISQCCALLLPNYLDHYIKENLGIKFYCRYMDDGCLIHNDKEYLKLCLNEIRRICQDLGIILNKKKTQIVKISRGIKFLKTRFILTNTGKIIRKPCKRNITQMRKKLKTFKRWVDEGKISAEDVRTSFLSWKGNQKKYNSHWSIRRAEKLYEKLGFPTLQNKKYKQGKAPCCLMEDYYLCGKTFYCQL